MSRRVAYSQDEVNSLSTQTIDTFRSSPNSDLGEPHHRIAKSVPRGRVSWLSRGWSEQGCLITARMTSLTKSVSGDSHRVRFLWMIGTEISNVMSRCPRGDTNPCFSSISTDITKLGITCFLQRMVCLAFLTLCVFLRANGIVSQDLHKQSSLLNDEGENGLNIHAQCSIWNQSFGSYIHIQPTISAP
jgi:hypothetical protein